MSRTLTVVTVFAAIATARIAAARSTRYTFLKPLKQMSCEMFLSELPNYGSERNLLASVIRVNSLIQMAKSESRNSGKSYGEISVYGKPTNLPVPVATSVVQRLNGIEYNLKRHDMDLKAFELRGAQVKDALLSIERHEPVLERAYNDLNVPVDYRAKIRSLVSVDRTVDPNYDSLKAVITKMLVGMERDRIFISSTDAVFPLAFHRAVMSSGVATQQARLAAINRSAADRFAFVDNIVFWDDQTNEPVWLFIYRAAEEQQTSRPSRRLSIDLRPARPEVLPEMNPAGLVPIKIKIRN